MSDFKLKMIIGEAQIELEGDGELVHTIFQELKDTGLGKLAPLIQVSSKGTEATSKPPANPLSKETEDALDNSNESLPELPSLQDVVLQGLPQKESDWLLIYAAYASDWGGKSFTREDLRAKYTETKRTTDARSKNFAANLRALSTSHYISAINNTEFRIDQSGIEKAKSIVLSPPSGKKANGSAGSLPKRSLPTYKPLDLGLSTEEREQFKEFWSQHNHSVNMDKAVLTAYWLKANKEITDFTAAHLFTMLRTIEETVSFDLEGAITNAKNKKNFFVPGEGKGVYTLYHIGEDHVKTLEIGAGDTE